MANGNLVLDTWYIWRFICPSLTLHFRICMDENNKHLQETQTWNTTRLCYSNSSTVAWYGYTWLFSRKFANFHCNLKCHLVSVSRVRHRYSKVKQRLKENIATWDSNMKHHPTLPLPPKPKTKNLHISLRPHQVISNLLSFSSRWSFQILLWLLFAVNHEWWPLFFLDQT